MKSGIYICIHVHVILCNKYMYIKIHLHTHTHTLFIHFIQKFLNTFNLPQSRLALLWDRSPPLRGARDSIVKTKPGDSPSFVTSQKMGN